MFTPSHFYIQTPSKKHLSTTLYFHYKFSFSIILDTLTPAGAEAPVRGPARTMLQDIARGLARRVPLTKLVTIDADVRPYLASLLVAAMHRAGDELVIPSDLKFR